MIILLIKYNNNKMKQSLKGSNEVNIKNIKNNK